MAAKKTTKKKTSKTSSKTKPAADKAGAQLDAAKARNADAKPDKNFMQETRTQDRQDAITKSLVEALKKAKAETQRAAKAIDLALATADDSTSDLHQLVEMSRRLSGEATRLLQESITKGRKAAANAGMSW